jgi:hypothetical protein
MFVASDMSPRVIRCRPVFEMASLNWRKTNPAYAPLSAHLPRPEYDIRVQTGLLEDCKSRVPVPF